MNGTLATAVDEYIDLNDLPRPIRQQAGSFIGKLRAIPEGKALFVPGIEGQPLLRVASRISVAVTDHHMRHRLYHTRQDKERFGVWVWWEPRP